jgi:hypothetical protein
VDPDPDKTKITISSEPIIERLLPEEVEEMMRPPSEEVLRVERAELRRLLRERGEL